MPKPGQRRDRKFPRPRAADMKKKPISELIVDILASQAYRKPLTKGYKKSELIRLKKTVAAARTAPEGSLSKEEIEKIQKYKNTIETRQSLAAQIERLEKEEEKNEYNYPTAHEGTEAFERGYQEYMARLIELAIERNEVERSLMRAHKMDAPERATTYGTRAWQLTEVSETEQEEAYLPGRAYRFIHEQKEDSWPEEETPPGRTPNERNGQGPRRNRPSNRQPNHPPSGLQEHKKLRLEMERTKKAGSLPCRGMLSMATVSHVDQEPQSEKLTQEKTNTAHQRTNEETHESTTQNGQATLKKPLRWLIEEMEDLPDNEGVLRDESQNRTTNDGKLTHRQLQKWLNEESDDE